jgi:hypothetical protein
LYVPAPCFAFEEDGELTGVTVGIMQHFVDWFHRHHGIQVELDFVAEEDWSVFYQRIVDAEGGVFGLGNVTITEARKEELQFSPAYMNNLAVLITPDSVAEASNEEELGQRLEDLQPLAFAGTLHEVRIRELRDRYQPDHDIARSNSNQDIIDRVASGEHYSYIDAYNYYRARDAGAAVRHHEAFNLSGETFGIIMPHSNDWEGMLTAFFAAEGGYRDSEQYQKLMRTHLGEQLAATLEEARQDAQ